MWCAIVDLHAQLVERLPRTSRVRVPPETALLFLLGKKELSSGVVALLCLVLMTDIVHVFAWTQYRDIHVVIRVYADQ